MAGAKSVQCVYPDKIKEQEVPATLQVAELEYSLLVMSYLNSESILPGITQKCKSGQRRQNRLQLFLLQRPEILPVEQQQAGPGKSFPATV